MTGPAMNPAVSFAPKHPCFCGCFSEAPASGTSPSWACKERCFPCSGSQSTGSHIPFELWCWRRFLRDPWTARRSNQSILKEISPEYSLEGLMLKLKLQYLGHMMRRKVPDAGKDWRQEKKGMTEDEMIGWHHQLDGHEFEQVLGVGDGQGSLACCSPWDGKELDMTEWQNWTELNWTDSWNLSEILPYFGITSFLIV